MAKQTCENCQECFTWKEIQASFFRGYRPLVCRKCKKVYKITDLSKLIIGILITFPVLFFVLIVASLLNLTGGLTFIFGVVLLGTIVSLHPYISSFEPAEEERNS